jgi:hypothetical protein
MTERTEEVTRTAVVLTWNTSIEGRTVVTDQLSVEVEAEEVVVKVLA